MILKSKGSRIEPCGTFFLIYSSHFCFLQLWFPCVYYLNNSIINHLLPPGITYTSLSRVSKTYTRFMWSMLQYHHKMRKKIRLSYMACHTFNVGATDRNCTHLAECLTKTCMASSKDNMLDCQFNFFTKCLGISDIITSNGYIPPIQSLM